MRNENTTLKRFIGKELKHIQKTWLGDEIILDAITYEGKQIKGIGHTADTIYCVMVTIAGELVAERYSADKTGMNEYYKFWLERCAG